MLNFSRPRPLASLALGAAVLVAGCGSSAKSTTSTPGATAPVPTATTAAPPAGTIEVLAPRNGAHTGSTVTVRVRVLSAAPAQPAPRKPFRYLLDGRARGSGGPVFRLAGLRAGRHRLTVVLAAQPAVRGTSSFVVRAAAAPAAHATTTTATTPTVTPTHTTPAPSAPVRRTPKAHVPTTPTHTTPSTPPKKSGGIPQGNGGDGDADNNGGPDDGDGNV